VIFEVQATGGRKPVDPGMSQSLERGLAVLALFKSGKPLMGVSEIGRALDLSRSTAHRYVATLAALGYLQQDRESKRYRLGPRVLDLGFSAINSMDVREISAPHLQQLSDETGHTVNMAIHHPHHRHRRQRRGARLRPALHRRADQRALGRSGGGAQPRGAPFDGPHERPDRALLTGHPAHGGCHLLGDSLTNGCRPLV
jgi:predicted transcriptional regulator